MNILRLVYEWPPPWDGLTPGPYELTQAQLKLGHQVMVFCGGGFKDLGKISCSRGACPASDKGDACVAATVVLEGPSSEKALGLRVFRFPRALKRFSLFLTTSPAVLLGYLFLKLIGRGPDLVHGHGHITLWFNLYKLFFGWLDKTPYVLHFHITAAGRERAWQGKESDSSLCEESDSGELPNSLDFWTKYFEWPLHKFSDWLGVRVADRVVCASPLVMGEAIGFYGADPEKMVVVENGVNTVRFIPPRHSEGASATEESPDESSSRRSFAGAQDDRSNGRHSEGASATEESPSERSFGPIDIGSQDDDVGFGFELLYVGALQPRKNVHLLIKALKFLSDDYRLTIAGRGNKEYEDRLRHLVRELEIENRVEFEGYIEYPDLPEVYQRASLFVLPSSYEGLPKVVLEALACGVPVLASGFDIQESISGLEFVDTLDPESLAERIREVLGFGVEVDVGAVQEWSSWEKKVLEIEQVYKELTR